MRRSNYAAQAASAEKIMLTLDVIMARSGWRRTGPDSWAPPEEKKRDKPSE